VNENNPFLNIFNGYYNGMNRYISLLANGLLPSGFNNSPMLFFSGMSSFFNHSNLEHFPTLVDNTSQRFPNFFNMFNRQRPSVFTGGSGWLKRFFQPNNNFQAPLSNDFNGFFPTLNPSNQKIRIPIVRDSIGKIIAW
jgi:hypothetical protein